MWFGCFTVCWQLNTCKIEFQATEIFSRHLPYPASVMNLEIWHQVPLYCTFPSRETGVNCWIFMDQRWTETLNYWNDSSIPCSLWGAFLRVKMSHSSSLLASARSVICEGPSKKPHKVLSLSGVDWKLLLVGIWNSLALVAWETGAALRRKRGDASVHMYSFDEAAVVYQDIQGRLSNDWFVLTALLSLVHQPQISASSSTFFFFF